MTKLEIINLLEPFPDNAEVVVNGFFIEEWIIPFKAKFYPAGSEDLPYSKGCGDPPPNDKDIILLHDTPKRYDNES